MPKCCFRSNLFENESFSPLENIHSTIPWDANNARFSGKLIHILEFSPLSPVWCWTYHTGISRNVKGGYGLLSWELKFCLTTDIFFHEQLDGELNYLRWGMFENWSLTVFALFFSGERKDVVPVKSSCHSLFSGMPACSHKRERQATHAEPKNKQG